VSWKVYLRKRLRIEDRFWIKIYKNCKVPHLYSVSVELNLRELNDQYTSLLLKNTGAVYLFAARI